MGYMSQPQLIYLIQAESLNEDSIFYPIFYFQTWMVSSKFLVLEQGQLHAKQYLQNQSFLKHSQVFLEFWANQQEVDNDSGKENLIFFPYALYHQGMWSCWIFWARAEVSLPRVMADLLYLNMLIVTCRSWGTVESYLLIQIMTTLRRLLNQFLASRSILVLANHVIVSILLGVFVDFSDARQTIFFHLLIYQSI